MAGKRQLLVVDEPFEHDGYPRLEMSMDLPTGTLLVGGKTVEISEHLGASAVIGQWYDVPLGGGLQLRMLPSGHIEVQTPDCDEPDAFTIVPSLGAIRMEPGENDTSVKLQCYGVAAAREWKPGDDEWMKGKISAGLLLRCPAGCHEETYLPFLSPKLAAILIAALEANAKANGLDAALIAELDQAREFTKREYEKE